MEVMVDSGGRLSKPTSISFVEVILGDPTSEPSVVHATHGDGSISFVKFENGCPPKMTRGVRLCMWGFENMVLSTGIAGYRLDLTGPGNWLFRANDDGDVMAKPAFGEFFAGLGGWTKGLQSMQMSSRVLVENNPTVAKACAACMQIPLVTVDEAYEGICQGIEPKTCVLLGDLMEIKTWTVIAFFELEVICMSPPCPPWSKASWESGLQVKEGRVFAQVFRLAPLIGVKVINVENVASITTHPHFKHLLSFAKEQAYSIVHSVVIDSYPYLPIKRERWLASFCDGRFKIPQITMEWASNVVFPTISQGIATLASRDCVQEHFGEGEWNELLPCPQAIIMMNQGDLLPSHFEKRHDHSVYHARICDQHMPIGGAMAMYGKQHTLPVELLRQKGLFTSLFRKDGSNDPPRYYTAWEFLAAMQWPMDTYLPRDKHDAWHAAGNAICIPHTVLCLFRMHGCMGEMSPWGNRILSLRKICWNIVEKAIKLSNMIPESIDEFKRLKFVGGDEDHDHSNNTPRHQVSKMEARSQILSPYNGGLMNQESRKSQGFVAVGASSPNINIPVRVLPVEDPKETATESHDKGGVDGGKDNGSTPVTGTFTHVLQRTNTIIDLESEDEHVAPRKLEEQFEMVKDENKEDKIFKKRPFNDDDTWNFEIGNIGEFCNGNPTIIEETFGAMKDNEMNQMLAHAMIRSGLPKIWPMFREVMLINPQTKWSRVSLVAFGKNVMDIIHDFLPYARPNQFFAVRVNSKSVSPLSVPPGIDRICVAFVPVEALCEVEMPCGTCIQCKVNVTTTFHDLAMQVNQLTGMHSENIVFFHEGTFMRKMEPVCMCSNPKFRARCVASVILPAEIPIATMKPGVITPPMHSDIMIASGKETL